MTDSAILEPEEALPRDANQASWSTELHELCTDTEQWIARTLQRLGWTKDHLAEQESTSMVTCPIDRNHRMPEPSLEKHVHYCKLRKHGDYTRVELDEDKSSKFLYEKAPSVVTIELDDCKLRQILSQSARGASWTGPNARRLPCTVQRSRSEFSVEERRRIYDACIAEVHSRQKPVTIPAEQLNLLNEESTSNVDDKSADPNSVEFLTKVRDAKRKRQSYRAKNVHITRKSHTEIIRDVLANQMTLLQQIWEADAKEKQQQSKPKHSDTSTVVASGEQMEKQEEEECSRPSSDTNNSDSESRSRHKKHRRSDKESSRHRRRGHISHKHKRSRHDDRYSRSPSRSPSSVHGEKTRQSPT